MSNSNIFKNFLSVYRQNQFPVLQNRVYSSAIRGIDIDPLAVERAAKMAHLHEFVVKDLPQGYATTVGERGVRLSGGQRQRIGIARALYHKPHVLILDEATSALDNFTEQEVMEAVNNLGHEITIIMIAHRLSTLRQCDQIYLLERGEVKAQGTFNELAKTIGN
jgi:ABC-type multidrug transport system fused ATPase/permease subunit